MSILQAARAGQVVAGTQHRSAGAGPPIETADSIRPDVNIQPLSDAAGPILFDPYVCLVADSLDDIEAVRIATENRVRQLTRSSEDADGEVRGLGLDVRSPEVARAVAIAEALLAVEKSVVLDLQRGIRKTPFHAWIKSNSGIGEKQAARLLAKIGDPYWNDLHGRPRTVSELWAYCGYSVSNGRAQRREKGRVMNWSPDAKMRVYLMAVSCVKARGGGHYRDVYDAARAKYENAVHPHDCVRCGPSGKPALAGTPLSLGHQHSRALRVVAKEILRDLWTVARDYHLSKGNSL